MELASKVVKIGSKIIISFPKSKSLKLNLPDRTIEEQQVGLARMHKQPWLDQL
jgi:hypothetical protein